MTLRPPAVPAVPAVGRVAADAADADAGAAAHPSSPVDGLQLLQVAPDDPRTRALFEALAQEYHGRYGDLRSMEDTLRELRRYPAAWFTPPRGNFVLLLRAGHVVAGGAFMPHADAGTAEFKRIWTDHAQRRQGLARRVLAELEALAVQQGYRRIYLGTGARQPEAVGLYANCGYQLLERRVRVPGHAPGFVFEKHLAATSSVRHD